MNDLKILEAHASDHAFLVESQVAMALETEGLKLDEKTVALGVGAVLLDSTKGRYYVVKNGSGERIACTLTIPEWSDWRNGTVLWIHSLFVRPEDRGRGVYRQLYAYLKEKVQSDPGLMGLRLYVDQRNERACAVYEKLGMSAEHYRLYEWMKTF
ncbi:MAG: GNAT family N-acetyltransferase [Bdellovibrionales bacterium]|nr:GNAT family N-acetyltransferase [Bdellovibrionales bacterium]